MTRDEPCSRHHQLRQFVVSLGYDRAKSLAGMVSSATGTLFFVVFGRPLRAFAWWTYIARGLIEVRYAPGSLKVRWRS